MILTARHEQKPWRCWREARTASDCFCTVGDKLRADVRTSMSLGTSADVIGARLSVIYTDLDKKADEQGGTSQAEPQRS